MPNLRDRDAYRDAAWDWSIFNGCLGGRIRPMDIDGVIERREHFLYIEAKPEGAEISQGQSLTLGALSRQPKSTVLVLWGPVNEPRRMVAYGEMEYLVAGCDLSDARKFVHRWFEMANG